MLRAVLALLGLLVAALVGVQLVLPRVAERRISDGLAATGEVRRVSVKAVPAIKLLFRRADRVEIDMAEARARTGRLVLEASAGVFTVRARLSARDGALVIAPDGLLGGLGSLTIFRDSRVRVTDVGSKVGADGFTVTAAGRVTD